MDIRNSSLLINSIDRYKYYCKSICRADWQTVIVCDCTSVRYLNVPFRHNDNNTRLYHIENNIINLIFTYYVNNTKVDNRTVTRTSFYDKYRSTGSSSNGGKLSRTLWVLNVRHRKYFFMEFRLDSNNKITKNYCISAVTSHGLRQVKEWSLK